MAPEIRELVRFERINLNAELPPIGLFDAVFCRNVLIYFDAPTKVRVLTRLAAKLAPGGYLMLGHAETVVGTRGLRSVAPNVYTRSEGGTVGAARPRAKVG
jgi:chemotaxis protein methyltransferase CheR